MPARLGRPKPAAESYRARPRLLRTRSAAQEVRCTSPSSCRTIPANTVAVGRHARRANGSSIQPFGPAGNTVFITGVRAQPPSVVGVPSNAAARRAEMTTRRVSHSGHPFLAQLAESAVGLFQTAETHTAQDVVRLRELDVAVVDDLDRSSPRGRGSRGSGPTSPSTPSLPSAVRAPLPCRRRRARSDGAGSGGCVRPRASAMNWSPMSMNAIPPPRPRSENSPKIRPPERERFIDVPDLERDVIHPDELRHSRLEASWPDEGLHRARSRCAVLRSRGRGARDAPARLLQHRLPLTGRRGCLLERPSLCVFASTGRAAESSGPYVGG